MEIGRRRQEEKEEEMISFKYYIIPNSGIFGW